MKVGIYLLCFLSCLKTWGQVQTSRPDTTIIEFADSLLNKHVKVVSIGDKELSFSRNLSLDGVLKAFGVDTSDRERALVLIAENKGKRDTLVLLTQSGQRLQIITKEPLWRGERDLEVDITLPSIPNDDSLQKVRPEKKRGKASENKKMRFFPKSDFGIYIGLNGFANGSPQASGQNYRLRAWPSRYIALSFRKSLNLVDSKKAVLALAIGPEIAWYNFVFENSNKVFFENGQVRFDDAGYATEKSKLVMPFVNLPAVLFVGFKESRLKVGLGGYVGYRVGGRVKTKDINNNKIKNAGSFGLANVPYGLTAELGRKGGLMLFCRYDLNKLFNSDQQKAKELQAFSVGIRI